MFALTNVGQNRAALLDTQFLAPLYDVRLTQLNELGEVLAEKHSEQRIFSDKGVLDTDRDARVELLPGSSLLRPIPLTRLFSLKPGRYRVTVVYQPKIIEQMSPSAVQAWEVFAGQVEASAELRWPWPEKSEKSEPTE